MQTDMQEPDMNEQGVAWLAVTSRHDPSPQDLRDRAHLRDLAARRPTRHGLRERLAAAIAGLPAIDGQTALALDCCVA
jgi:hypothetical protein